MRRIHISKSDFALFHQDVTSLDYEFFKNHDGAFKRMWNEQTRSFWIVFVDMFDHFIWNYGVMKDFPLKIDEVHRHVEEIISLITLYFIEGNASSAKTLITECVTVAKNQHYIGTLDKASYGQNPFYIKGTREPFRKLFGMPRSKNTFMKVLCGLPVYIKFAGSVVTLLRRWLSADNLEDSTCIDAYLSQLTSIRASDKASLEAIERALAREKRREESEKSVKKVSKRHFANESTKLKALEWVDDSKNSVADELEELDPLPSERKSYKSEYKNAIQSVTEGVRNSLVESIAEVKRKEIELAREKGEDPDRIIEEFKEDLAKRKPPSRRKKRRKGGGGNDTGDDEISCLMNLHKELSSSDRYLEAIGAKRPQGSLLPPCITEVTDTDEENDPFNKEEKENVKEKEEINKETNNLTVQLDTVVDDTCNLEPTSSNETAATIDIITSVVPASNTDPQIAVILENETQFNDHMKEEQTASIEHQQEKEEEYSLKEEKELADNNDTQLSVKENATNSVEKEHHDTFNDILLKEESHNITVDPITNDQLLLSSEKNDVQTINSCCSNETNNEIDTESLSSSQQDDALLRTESPEDCCNEIKRKLLHVCSYCQKKEEVAKTFKRCVKCRGKPHPHYYCSKSCQINEWKAGHRLAHKNDPEIN